MSLMVQHRSAAAVEAVRVITALLTHHNEPDRIGRAQRAAAYARAAAEATTIAEAALNTVSSAIEARTARSAAEAAERLLTLF